MKYPFYFLLFIFLMGCKTQKYQLVESNALSLKEGYYIEIPPGTFEGKTAINAVLTFEKFDKTAIKFLGIYFRNEFVATSGIKDSFKIEAGVYKENFKKLKEDNIPFKLKKYEVVLSYFYKGKQKYTKYTLQKKSPLGNIPM